MARKNARKGAFISSAADYRIADGDDFRATISAKDFPERGEFRVYRVYGDINRPERLKAAICNLLAERGIDKRRVLLSL